MKRFIMSLLLCGNYGKMRSMDRHEIHKLIKDEIRSHELRVAILSGIPGLILLAGTWHAIWMLR